MFGPSTKSNNKTTNKFHSTPRTVTEENQKFWKGDAPLGASICKDCLTLFLNSYRNKMQQAETSPGENMV
jgi:hypothetical protein